VVNEVTCQLCKVLRDEHNQNKQEDFEDVSHPMGLKYNNV